MTKLEFEDIQGFVFSGYGKRMLYASYHLLKIDDPDKAKVWLRALLEEDRITRGVHRGKTWCLNIAFTRRGLDRLGHGNGSTFPGFELAFQQGMASERRAHILGDNGPSDPKLWNWGNEKRPIDVLLLVFGSDETVHDDRKDKEERFYKANALSQVIEPLIANPLEALSEGEFGKEHFGFADGVSQPAIRDVSPDHPDAINTGEFILGYENEYHRVTEVPTVSAKNDPQNVLPPYRSERHVNLRDLGRNGTYLVFRQLEQKVSGFWNFVAGEAKDEAEQEWLAAKIVGRWPSGALVVDGAAEDPGGPAGNDFNYARTDPHGYGCPLGSHIRRTNPRAVGLGATPERSLQVANRHRLLRRGRSYGPRVKDRYKDDEEKRGLLFLCINANIERQFEFVQHTWLNNVKFAGLYDERDPLLGAVPGNERGSMSIPQRPVRRRVHGLERFVTLRGGAYFFLPGIKALRYLSTLKPNRAPAQPDQ